MSKYSKVVDVLAESISNNIPESSYDISTTGQITEVLSGNKYTVKVKGSAYTLPSLVSGLTVGNTVWILIPQSNYSQMFIIGKILTS
jgi:hypothetical protein